MLPIGGTSDEVKCEDLVKITIEDDPEKFFQVGSQLPQQEKEELVEFLNKTLTSLPGILMRLQGWIQNSSATI